MDLILDGPSRLGDISAVPMHRDADFLMASPVGPGAGCWDSPGRSVSGVAYRHVMVFALPDGLPPGRIGPPGSARVWISNDLPQGIERLWGLLLGQQATSGLFPLLCWPGSPTRYQDLAEVDAILRDHLLATLEDLVSWRSVSDRGGAETGMTFPSHLWSDALRPRRTRGPRQEGSR